MAAAPAPSLRSRAVVAYLRAQRRRRRYEDLARFHAALAERQPPERCGPSATLRWTCAVARGRIAGAPCWRIAPKGRAGAEAPIEILYLHGGAYVFEIGQPHWWLIGKLANATGAAVTVPLYPLAPEHPCDEGFAVVLAAYRALLERVPAERIVVMGDSAGGGLTLALAQLAREQGLPQPARLTLLAPWLDVTCSNPDIDPILPHDPMLALPGAREAGRMWAGSRALDDPLVSPLHADLTGLAPISQHVGTRDICLPDTRLLRDRAQAAGHPFEHVEYPGMFHVFMAAPIPEARRAQAGIGAAFTTPSPITTPQEEPPRWTSS